MARKRCLLAPQERGLHVRAVVVHSAGAAARADASLLPPGEGAPRGRMRVRAKPRAVGIARASPRTLTPTPAPRPGPRKQRGCFKGRAPMARKLCLLAPQGEGLH
ncbi:hypothetical protein XabCFBP2524_10440 [Xanthomonas axonopodis pv. begoniae]|nr:hypothetical protein XabCFBP2524_10440 [Xanthomonas axonopodis pv. begoniae]